MSRPFGLVSIVAISGVLFVAAPAFAQDTGSNTPETPSTVPTTAPRWSEFPAPPENVPTAADIRMKVNAELVKQKQLQAELATLVWDPQEPDKIYADAVSHIDPAHLAPVDTAMTPAQADAYAQALRTKAAPPPIAQ